MIGREDFTRSVRRNQQGNLTTYPFCMTLVKPSRRFCPKPSLKGMHLLMRHYHHDFPLAGGVQAAIRPRDDAPSPFRRIARRHIVRVAGKHDRGPLAVRPDASCRFVQQLQLCAETGRARPGGSLRHRVIIDFHPRTAPAVRHSQIGQVAVISRDVVDRNALDFGAFSERSGTGLPRLQNDIL